ncbi:HNH endonuclease [Demequina soli]|uniref:HNH endonuclease n=1 Tax=Demequina soli TaxID=1638987 RepID=UPI0007858963|nr:DUF222 domain-containing protein [Demequina soli]
MDAEALFDCEPGGGATGFAAACLDARIAVGTMRAFAAAGGSPDVVDRLHGAARVARELDLVLARTARDIEVQSDAPGGGLAKLHGHRSAADLVAASMGTTRAQAIRLLEVGRALEEVEQADGPEPPEDDPPVPDDPPDPDDRDTPPEDEDEDKDDPPAPPKPQPRYPMVAAALAAAEISADCGAQIIAMLDSLSDEVTPERKREAEAELVKRARGLDATRFARVVRRFKAAIDVAAHQRSLARLRRARFVRIWENRAGMTVINAELDPETAAPVVAALGAIVGHDMHASKDHPGTDTRTTDQMRADALAAICRHGLSCEASDLPLANVTVVIRVDAESLATGEGLAEIDGCTTPVDIPAVFRMAPDPCIVPVTLSAAGAVLNWGRERRLFTRAQKRALAERDGGCAFCGAPPAWTEAHHIVFWSRGGRTDLDNGVLLCSHCHHVIHDQGWTINASATEVWFIPPASVDPARAPRQGGRARFGAPRHWSLAAYSRARTRTVADDRGGPPPHREPDAA